MSEGRTIRDDVWKSSALVENFLSGVRGGIPYAADQIEIMLRLVAAEGRPVVRFLDLGSGDGTLSAAILSRYPDAEAVLVDFSEPMMEAARRRIDGAASRHRFVLTDFGQSGWSRGIADAAPFDLVVSGFAIHHQPDAGKRAVYRAIFDLLSPGAFFINVEHVRPATPWLEWVADELMIDSIHAYHERAGTGKSRDQVARDHVHRPDKAANILAPVEAQCDWLREIGYEDVDCYFKVLELAVFGGRRPGPTERPSTA
jgi:SAM-dependent methyltransferase